MPRPRKSTIQAIEDSFFAMPIPDQVATLTSLETIHRLARRGVGRTEKQQPKEPGQQPIELQSMSNAASKEGL